MFVRQLCATLLLTCRSVKSTQILSQYRTYNIFPASLERLRTLTNRTYAQDAAHAAAAPAVVDYEYVVRALKNDDILIIDVRDPEEIKEFGKIPNSINIPVATVSSVLSAMSEQEFQSRFGKKKPSSDTEIIFYCKIGRRAGYAQKDALDLGYTNVKNYLGSWTDWATKVQ